MTIKQASTDWADHIGASDLPVDEFTFTEGSNYGLDGFAHDGTMNEGVLQGARLPSVRGLSGLPDGLVSNPKGASVPEDKLTEDQWGVDLSSMLSEAEGALYLSKEAKEAASLVDLSWLDPMQKQDPARLPKGLHPEDENANAAIPELVEAWGSGKQTTGLELVPGVKEREVAQYEKEIAAGPKSGLPGTPVPKTATPTKADDIREVLYRAMRRSTFGHPLTYLKAEAANALGADAPRAKKAMAQIADEHGLAGRVFIRAAAFPGIKNGKWVKELRRAAPNARYVITDDPAVADKLKMEMVSEVPWKKALAHYRPLLKAAGHRVASKGDPQAILRAAFQTESDSWVRQAHQPVDVRPADRVTTEEAKQAFDVMPHEKRQVLDLMEKQAAVQRRKALVRVAKWVRAGLLDRADALKLQAAKVPVEVVLKTAAQLIVASGRSASYAGTGTHQIPKVASVTREAAWAGLRAAESKVDEDQKALEAHRIRQFKLHVAKMVRGGLMTQDEAGRLVALNRPLGELYRMASAVAAQREKSVGSKQAAQESLIYRGTVYKTATARRLTAQDFGDEDKHVIALAKKAGVHSDDIPQVLRWAKGQRKAGVELSDLAPKLKAEFGPKVVEEKAYQGVIFEQATSRRLEARDFSVDDKRLFAAAKKAGVPAHNLVRVLRFARQQMTEGLVGDDLDAMLKAKFAQPVRKAARPILRVLRDEHEGLSGHLYVDAGAYMSPTGTSGCEEGALKHRTNGLKYVLAADRCSGCIHASDDRCKLYRKVLAAEVPTKNPKVYQRKVLAASKATDAENTASYFDSSEFDLNDPMDNIELTDAASVASLGEILFGEM